MVQQRFYIKGRMLDANDTRLQEALDLIYETPERPRCMCVQGGVEMYVAQHRQFVVKRMPGTGNRHHPACPSYEAEYGQSGLGQLMGEAVIEHSPVSIELRVGFPLARIPGKPIPRGEPCEAAEISAPRQRMSLRAVMHFLFERAGFNRWYPTMEGKRSQAVIHKYLMEAADDVMVKGTRLSERLFVPEQFSEERKVELAERRRRKLAILQSPMEDERLKMALVLGEFKGAEESSYGRKVWIKHMPDVPLFVDNKTWERIERAYRDILEACDSDAKGKQRIVVCALVYARREHTYQIDTATFMLTTETWIPIEGIHEADLIHTLIEQKRRFIKPLRYDARSAAGFANALLLDTGEMPTPLHIVSQFAEPRHRIEKERAIKLLRGFGWVWYSGQEIPSLPDMLRQASHTGKV